MCPYTGQWPFGPTCAIAGTFILVQPRTGVCVVAIRKQKTSLASEAWDAAMTEVITRSTLASVTQAP